MKTRKLHAIIIARKLRRTLTHSERTLWNHLRNRKFRNLKFLRQHPIIYGSVNGRAQFFVADFYCDELKLVLELDGPIHETQKEYDEVRDQIIQELGLHVLRIKNEELSDMEWFFNKLKEYFVE
ncbi:MAG: endonuclease domain-containing protein [Saprospiraceae bacterium]|nr:endonuclease domain-containing protein [Saprospiraceae bacterium]